MNLQTPLGPSHAKALGYERQYDWKEAAKCYREISEADREFNSHHQLKLAECYERAAYQTETAEELRTLLEAARTIYTKCEDQPESINKSTAHAHRLRLESLLSPRISEARSLLDEAILIQRGVLEQPKATGDDFWMRECNLHLLLLRDRICLDDGSVSKELLREAFDLIKQAISSTPLEAMSDIAGEVYSYYIHFAGVAADFLEQYRDRTLQARIINEAAVVWPHIQDRKTMAMLLVALAYICSFTEEKSDTAQKYVSRALDAARAAKDNYLIGRTLWVATYLAKWKVVAAVTLEDSRKHFDEICSDFEEIKRLLQHLPDASSRTFLVHSYSEVIEAHTQHALFISNLEQKKTLLSRAVSIFREGVTVAQLIGGSDPLLLGTSGAYALRWLAYFEDDGPHKDALLTEALAIAERLNALTPLVEPTFLWNVGQRQLLEGTIRYELANLSATPTKKELLELATQRFREGISTLVSDALFQAAGKLIEIAAHRARFADVLESLFRITGDPDLTEEALQVLEAAAVAYSSASWHARAAECLWRTASLLSVSGKHELSASAFVRAAKEYRMMTGEPLAGFYSQYANYMDGWNRIELAKHSHDRSDFSNASLLYRASLKYLRQAGFYACLRPYFKALMLLERASQLSLEGRHPAARSRFAVACSAFFRAVETLRTARASVQGQLERADIERFLYHARAYAAYSSSRALIERATALDEDWRLEKSVTLYENAAKEIEELTGLFEDPEERREVKALNAMSSALAKLRRAQLAPDTEPYQAAARLFLEARDLTSSTHIGHLVEGNASLAMAMEQILKFLRGDDSSYGAAKNALEGASRSFSQIGLRRYETWIIAAQRQLDGYMYARRAEREEDPNKKGQFYGVAENNLRLAKEHFQTAGDRASVDEAIHQLQKVKKAKSIYTKGREPIIVPPSIQYVMSAPIPSTYDRPAGLEYFDGPNILANVEYPAEIEFETEFTVRVELINIGKGPALLLRVENVLPSHFRLTRVPGGCKTEDGTLVFATRKLDPTIAETYMLQAVAKQAGPFMLSPRVVYVDEKGEIKIKKLQPAILAVRRPVVLDLENKNAAVILDYLARRYVNDENLGGLARESCGWTSRTQVIKETSIPKTAVYGKRSGRVGPALTELLAEDFVEMKEFAGERGRGGNITKIRVAAENEAVMEFLRAKRRKPLLRR